MYRSALLSPPLILLACSPASVIVGDKMEIEETTENGENNNSPENLEDRCCYTIEMFDAQGNGWDQGFIEVIIDDEVYAQVQLLTDGGYQEICPHQGSTLTMDWYPSAFNEEVGFMVYSPEQDIIAQERRPSRGTFLNIDVACAENVTVAPDYQEEGSVDVIHPDDPNNPDHSNPDGSVFNGEYSGYFYLRNSQTGYQICEVDLPVEINDGEIFSQGPCFTPNGHELFIEHHGSIELEDAGWGQTGGGPDLPPDFAYGYTYGEVAMTVPSGDLFTSEFWGECFAEGNYIGMYVWWEMMIQAPNETRYYQGELQVY